jgi:hypothetical protein
LVGHRKPPMPAMEPQPIILSFFPQMGPDGWCGKYDHGISMGGMDIDLSKLETVGDGDA